MDWGSNGNFHGTRDVTNKTTSIQQVSRYQLVTTAVVIDLVTFEHLVETFKDEGPEAIDRSVVEDLFDDVSNIMEVWFNLVTMQLSDKLAQASQD